MKRVRNADEEQPDEEGGEDVDKLVTRHEDSIYFYASVSMQSVIKLLSCVHEAKRDGIRTIFLHIHSYGGDAFAGLVAYHHLHNEESLHIVTIVDGMAASAATFILLAGEERRAYRFSFVLIHQLTHGIFGKYRDMVDEMNNTHSLMKVFVRLYKERTSMTPKAIHTLLKSEKALTASQCYSRGIIDAIISSSSPSSHLSI